jgi:hypothetical protein
VKARGKPVDLHVSLAILANHTIGLCDERER